MTLIGAVELKNLNKHHIRVLQSIEAGMKNAEFVEDKVIVRYSNLPEDKVNQALKYVHKLDLIHRWVGHFVGYELTIHGYDALALNALYESGTITGIGREKGMGKESKVYYGLSGNNEEVILKIHRIGYTSFHHVKKKRRYTANKKHISELYASRLSAEEEAKWLKKSNDLGLNVPKLLAINRHIVVQELIHGIDLYKLNSLENPSDVLEEIIEFIKKAWNEGEFVHADLSEHNIIINYDNKPIIIDFPQAVEKTHENAKELLERDIGNILTFFSRKIGIESDKNEVIDYIINN